MKVFRAILTILGCALIVLGGYSAVTFLMQRDFAPVQEPTVEAPQPAEPEQPEETPEEPTQPAEDPELEARHSRAQEILRDMSLEEKIYQLMFVRPEAITGVDQVTVAGQTTQEALGRCPVGGLVYRADNLESEDQAKELLEKTAAYLEDDGQIAPFLGVFDDGSETSPVAGDLAGETLDSFATVGHSGSGGQAEQLGKDLGKTLADYHFNVNLAAGAELSSDRSDCFSADGEEAAMMVSSYVTGLQSENVAAVLAHFPGEGAAENGVCDKAEEELRQSDLLPFTAGIEAGAAIIQVSNMTATELDTAPCCLSSAVITDLLRDSLGFTGVILTDPLGGQTISAQYDEAEAAILALNAGADMLYELNDPEGVYTAILSAIQNGELTEERIDESVTRILCAKLQLQIIES